MPDEPTQALKNDRILENVKVELGILIGKANPTMGTLSALDVDDVLPLDSKIDDPVTICIGNRLIAEGVLEELSDDAGGSIGVRITRVIQHSQS